MIRVLKQTHLSLVLLIMAFASMAEGYSCRKATPPTEPAKCLACNLKYEAGKEPDDGKAMVMYTVYNRALNRFGGKSGLCSQVYMKNQFSWTREGKSGGAKDPKITAKDKELEDFVAKIMKEIADGKFEGKKATCATYYHTLQKDVGGMKDYPAWSAYPNKKHKKGNNKMKALGQVGAHLVMRPYGQKKCINKAGDGEIGKLAGVEGEKEYKQEDVKTDDDGILFNNEKEFEKHRVSHWWNYYILGNLWRDYYYPPGSYPGSPALGKDVTPSGSAP